MSVPADTSTSFFEATETILWEGAPRRRAYMSHTLLPTAAAAFFLIIGGWWEYLALTTHYLFVYPLLGVVMPAIGLYGVFVRPALVWRFAQRLRDVVTDRRVVVSWGDGPKHHVALVGAEISPYLVRTSVPGDEIIFAAAPRRLPLIGWWNVADQSLTFRYLDDAAGAVAALERLRRSHGDPTAWAAGVATPGSGDISSAQ